MDEKKYVIKEIIKETESIDLEINENPKTPQTKAEAIVVLVLGFASIVSLLRLPYASLLFGIVGMVLGINARKETKATTNAGRGIATAGLVCSIIGLVVVVVIFVWTIFFPDTEHLQQKAYPQ